MPPELELVTMSSAKKFIQRCLQPHSSRPSASQLLDDPFLQANDREDLREVRVNILQQIIDDGNDNDDVYDDEGDTMEERTFLSKINEDEMIIREIITDDVKDDITNRDDINDDIVITTTTATTTEEKDYSNTSSYNSTNNNNNQSNNQTATNLIKPLSPKQYERHTSTSTSIDNNESKHIEEQIGADRDRDISRDIQSIIHDKIVSDGRENYPVMSTTVDDQQIQNMIVSMDDGGEVTLVDGNHHLLLHHPDDSSLDRIGTVHSNSNNNSNMEMDHETRRFTDGGRSDSFDYSPIRSTNSGSLETAENDDSSKDGSVGGPSSGNGIVRRGSGRVRRVKSGTGSGPGVSRSGGGHSHDGSIDLTTYASTDRQSPSSSSPTCCGGNGGGGSQGLILSSQDGMVTATSSAFAHVTTPFVTHVITPTVSVSVCNLEDHPEHDDSLVFKLHVIINDDCKEIEFEFDLLHDDAQTIVEEMRVDDELRFMADYSNQIITCISQVVQVAREILFIENNHEKQTAERNRSVSDPNYGNRRIDHGSDNGNGNGNVELEKALSLSPSTRKFSLARSVISRLRGHGSGSGSGDGSSEEERNKLDIELDNSSVLPQSISPSPLPAAVELLGIIPQTEIDTNTTTITPTPAVDHINKPITVHTMPVTATMSDTTQTAATHSHETTTHIRPQTHTHTHINTEQHIPVPPPHRHMTTTITTEQHHHQLHSSNLHQHPLNEPHQHQSHQPLSQPHQHQHQPGMSLHSAHSQSHSSMSILTNMNATATAAAAVSSTSSSSRPTSATDSHHIGLGSGLVSVPLPVSGPLPRPLNRSSSMPLVTTAADSSMAMLLSRPDSPRMRMSSSPFPLQSSTGSGGGSSGGSMGGGLVQQQQQQQQQGMGSFMNMTDTTSSNSDGFSGAIGIHNGSGIQQQQQQQQQMHSQQQVHYYQTHSQQTHHSLHHTQPIYGHAPSLSHQTPVVHYPNINNNHMMMNSPATITVTNNNNNTNTTQQFVHSGHGFGSGVMSPDMAFALGLHHHQQQQTNPAINNNNNSNNWPSLNGAQHAHQSSMNGIPFHEYLDCSDNDDNYDMEGGGDGDISNDPEYLELENKFHEALAKLEKEYAQKLTALAVQKEKAGELHRKESDRLQARREDLDIQLENLQDKFKERMAAFNSMRRQVDETQLERRRVRSSRRELIENPTATANFPLSAGGEIQENHDVP
eukprot:gene9913-20613_t